MNCSCTTIDKSLSSVHYVTTSLNLLHASYVNSGSILNIAALKYHVLMKTRKDAVKR